MCTQDCSTPRADKVALSTLVVEAWGPLATTRALLDECLRPAEAAVYSTYGVTAQSVQSVGSTSSSSSSSGTSSAVVPWSWVLLLEAGAPADAADALAACMRPRVLAVDARPLLPDAVLVSRLIQNRSCGGRHWEWNGDAVLQACTCVAGYEEVLRSLVFFSGFDHIYTCFDLLRPSFDHIYT